MTDQLISGAGYHLCRTYGNDCPGYLGVNYAESYPAEDGGVMETRTCDTCGTTYYFHQPDRKDATA